MQPTKLCLPRIPHRCCVCAETIQPKEPCERWSYLDGRTYKTSYAHPECLDAVSHWDADDWESSFPGDKARPKEKRKCFVCLRESIAWISLSKRPRHVCSVECYRVYTAGEDIT